MSELTQLEMNTKEQYESLGRFVEAFEAMVSEVRETCIKIMSPKLDDDKLPQIIFHHQSLSAKPLFEIMRAMIAEILKDAHSATEAERKIFEGVIRQVNKEYFDLANTRNNLLHGTWFIGFTGSEDEHASEFYVRKLTTKGSGLAEIALPRKAADIKKLTTRCNVARDFISVIAACLPFVGIGMSVERKFKFNAKEWDLTSESGFPPRRGTSAE